MKTVTYNYPKEQYIDVNQIDNRCVFGATYSQQKYLLSLVTNQKLGSFCWVGITSGATFGGYFGNIDSAVKWALGGGTQVYQFDNLLEFCKWAAAT